MKYILLFLTLALIPRLHAQFIGGEGDGTSAGLTIQLDLSGVPSGTRPLFAGGFGDGYHQATGFGSLGDQDFSSLFAGGRGDGFDRRTVSASLSGQELSGLFSGGIGDGFDQFSVSLSLNGTDLSGLFSGGDGDGYDNLSVSASLNGLTLEGLYGGGDGDGYDNLAFNGLLDGDMLMLFGGGDGDGYDHAQVANSLGGADLSSLYGGGDGDGFDVVTFSGIVPLPLTLISFEAFPQEEFVLLQWVTEDEFATDFFTIEKTRDGREFAWVGEETAAGFSEPGERIYYEMEDHDPYLGTSFYRLKTTDLDGALNLSHLVEVNYSTARDWDFTLFPNPNTGRHFSLLPEGLQSGEELNIEVLDANGRILFQKQLEAGDVSSHRFDLADRLPPGSYLIRAVHAELGTMAKILIVGGQ
ncbi:MAG: T9SS type A sorting domain-containing protein [Bacteroidota bacterium]